MRIALLADIHGNSLALDAVLADIQATGGVDGYWVLGDLVAIGHDPVGALERLSRLPNAQFIRGNTDRYVVSGERPAPSYAQVVADIERLPVIVEVSATFAWTLGMVTAGGWLDWLRGLPLEFCTRLPSGAQALCIHAQPGKDDGWGILPGMSDQAIHLSMNGCQADLVCVGHTHYVIDRRVGRWHVVNPGSISNPHHTDLRASYALLDAGVAGYRIEHRRVDYDRAAVVQALEALGHPARRFIIHALEQGGRGSNFPLQTLVFQPIHRQQIEVMTSWRYDPPYDLYNLNHPPAEEEVAYYLDPVNAFHTVLNETGEMVAFCSFGPDGQVGGGDYTADALDIGMGVRPDLTGDGLGVHFAHAALDYAQATYRPNTVRVTIAAFNQRARRVWEKLGFYEIQQFASHYDGRAFIILVKRLVWEEIV